jgi:hypothetical protein
VTQSTPRHFKEDLSQASVVPELLKVRNQKAAETGATVSFSKDQLHLQLHGNLYSENQEVITYANSSNVIQLILQKGWGAILCPFLICY